MDVSYVTALAALGGTTLGGFTSFATQWTTMRSERKSKDSSNSRARRRTVYKKFIEESSKMYGDALVHNVMDFPGLIGLYSLISMMRVISSQTVIDHAVQVAQKIAAIYNQPNRTLAELEAMIETDAVDLLQPFSDACRRELEASHKA
jgi:hypothetical protein